MTGYYLGWNVHHTDIFYNRLFCSVGATKLLVLIKPEAPRLFRGALLRRNSSPSFTNCEWNSGEGEKGEFLSP